MKERVERTEVERLLGPFEKNEGTAYQYDSVPILEGWLENLQHLDIDADLVERIKAALGNYRGPRKR